MVGVWEINQLSTICSWYAVGFPIHSSVVDGKAVSPRKLFQATKLCSWIWFCALGHCHARTDWRNTAYEDILYCFVFLSFVAKYLGEEPHMGVLLSTAHAKLI